MLKNKAKSICSIKAKIKFLLFLNKTVLNFNNFFFLIKNFLKLFTRLPVKIAIKEHNGF